MANVKQTQKMIPFITRETSFSQMSASLFFGVDVFNLNFGMQINSITQPVKCNSVVLETCLLVGLLPLMIILITASLSSNTYKKVS